MTPQFSNVVYSVLGYALELKERLDKGASPVPDIEIEQSELRARLLTEIESRRLPDYGGDGSVYLGARYALTCFVDELFIGYSSWGSVWNDRKLEAALYGTNDRAWRFWDQADIVLRRPSAPRTQSQPGLDGVEAVFLCIVLGFRGKYLENPSKVKEYVDDLRPQVTRAEAWESPADRGVKTNVQPLAGREALRRVVGIYGGLTVAATFLLLVVFLLSF